MSFTIYSTCHQAGRRCHRSTAADGLGRILRQEEDTTADRGDSLDQPAGQHSRMTDRLHLPCLAESHRRHTPRGTQTVLQVSSLDYPIQCDHKIRTCPVRVARDLGAVIHGRPLI